jgi:hypothetical protein
MAGKGRKVIFHGAYASKADAKTKERKVGGYVQKSRDKWGHLRWLVLTRRKGHSS